MVQAVNDKIPSNESGLFRDYEYNGYTYKVIPESICISHSPNKKANTREFEFRVIVWDMTNDKHVMDPCYNMWYDKDFDSTNIRSISPHKDDKYKLFLMVCNDKTFDEVEFSDNLPDDKVLICLCNEFLSYLDIQL